MAEFNGDPVMALRVMQGVDAKWLDNMPTNFMLVIAAQMIGLVGYARTVDALRDLADIIEKQGMEMEFGKNGR